MAENSKIEWTHHTFNPWRGCTKVSAGCAHCYAETLAGRNPAVLGIWGKRGARVIAADSYWKQPLKWNRDALAAGERRRVFCASLADVFEGQDSMPEDAWAPVVAARTRLFDLIRATPQLDWLLLTKRPENIAAMLPADWGAGYPNVWLGTSVENQAAADARIPHLLAVPASVRFLSCEPLLGAVSLDRVFGLAEDATWADCLCGEIDPADRPCIVCDGRQELGRRSGLHWVIVGGESGPGARPMHPEWAMGLRDQCQAAGVAFLFKQWGEWLPKIYLAAWPANKPVWGCLGPGGRFSEGTTTWNGRQGGPPDYEYSMVRVGKKASGRQLDGRTWDEYPEVAHAGL